jgi:exo-beta-1,3-glucanase (GH17 family)
MLYVFLFELPTRTRFLSMTQLSNVHAWFANVSVQDGAAWTADFFQVNNVDVANALPNKPKMYIAETGWPTVKIHREFITLSSCYDTHSHRNH